MGITFHLLPFYFVVFSTIFFFSYTRWGVFWRRITNRLWHRRGKHTCQKFPSWPWTCSSCEGHLSHWKCTLLGGTPWGFSVWYCHGSHEKGAMEHSCDAYHGGRSPLCSSVGRRISESLPRNLQPQSNFHEKFPNCCGRYSHSYNYDAERDFADSGYRRCSYHRWRGRSVQQVGQWNRLGSSATERHYPQNWTNVHTHWI